MKQISAIGRVGLLLILSLLFTFGFSLGVCAAESEALQKTPLILIEAAAPDENGYFDVTVSAENLDFLVAEIALRYSTDIVVPVDTDSGEKAASFDAFATTNPFDGVSRIGEKLDLEKGCFLFTLFASPGTKTDYVWDKMVHFGEKTELYRFRFQKIAEGDIGLTIASVYDGGVYDPFFPDGAVITSAKEERPVSDVVIRVYGTENKLISEQKQKTVYYYYSELFPKNYTKQQRLSGTVYLVKGDYAAAVDGALAAIDAGNRAVVPTETDGKMLYPLRFVCESLKCKVAWDEQTGTASVTRPDGTVTKIHTSPENVVCEDMTPDDLLSLKDDRIMASETLLGRICGARSYKTGNATIFYTGLPEWTPEREAEKQALEAMQYVMMPFFRMFLEKPAEA